MFKAYASRLATLLFLVWGLNNSVLAANSATALQQLDPAIAAVYLSENSTKTLLGSALVVDAEKKLLATTTQVVPAESNSVGKTIAIKLLNGAEIPAQVWAVNLDQGLVLLQVNDKNINLVAAQGTEEIAVGDFIVSVGRNQQNVSALKLGMVTLPGTENPEINTPESLIGTDVGVTRSSKGGPLINVNGAVIGINVDADPAQEYENKGYAIPYRAVTAFIEESIAAAEEKLTGRIGAHIQHVTQKLADYYQQPVNKGVLVSYIVPGGAAELFGVKAGDLATSIGQQQVNNVSEFKNIISGQEAGEYFDLHLLRHGEPRTITLKTAATPHEVNVDAATQPRLGSVRLSSVDETNGEYGVFEGVVLNEVTPGSPAALAGLRNNDLIFRVNQIPVTGIQGLSDVLTAIDKAVVLSVKRGRAILLVVLPK